MPTVSKSIGTTPEHILNVDEVEWCDVIIQNLSANNLYVGSDATVSATTGLKVIANGVYTNDHRIEPIVLVADGAGSDVRLHYILYKDFTRRAIK